MYFGICTYILWHPFSICSDLQAKVGHVIHSVSLSSAISEPIPPIWPCSMAGLGAPRPAKACLTCHCVVWCDAMLNQPICSRPSWLQRKHIGGKQEEKRAFVCWAWQGVTSQKIYGTTVLKWLQKNKVATNFKSGFVCFLSGQNRPCVICSPHKLQNQALFAKWSLTLYSTVNKT